MKKYQLNIKSPQKFLTLVLGVVLGVILANSPVLYADNSLSDRSVQALFAEKCFSCHGPDKSEGGLRLDLAKFATAELESGDFAIVAGDPEQSTLLDRIKSKDESERMPPEGDPLTDKQVAQIREWIAAGAKFDLHWAYRPISLPEVPKVAKSDWPANEIDQFVLRKLQQKDVRPSDIASRNVLIKRVYYDLLGILPTQGEVDDFIKSNDPKAYEKLVDRLLASRHFGERWGRHWLDKARYADSDGYEKDRPRPNAWRYRDWVINAVNSDMPFDQFTVEQIAGDLLPDADPEQVLATAFHRQTLTNTEGGTDQEEFRVEATFDRTETVGSIWMGLTLTCARCHTHKYDQISQREYFELYSFFNNANESNLNIITSPEAAAGYHAQLDAHQRAKQEVENAWAEIVRSFGAKVDPWLKNQRALAAKETTMAFHEIEFYKRQSASGAKIRRLDDQSNLVEGKVTDKDKYTLFATVPDHDITGIRLETLTGSELPSRGPGRAPNGNFVLSQLRVYGSDNKEFKKHQQIKLSSARADFSQNQFSAAGALVNVARSGWAISPQMGKPHHLEVFFSQPINSKKYPFLQIVLDQQYGGKHTIGKFRVKLISGGDPLLALPPEIIALVRQTNLNESQRQQVAEYLARNDSTAQKKWAQLESLRSESPKKPEMSVRVIAPASRETRILNRGDFLQPGEPVSSGVLEVIRQGLDVDHSKNEQPTRLDLAKWLVDPRHPLTARVAVNQVWLNLFGNGIVATPNDFGVRGETPSHPELLDWLAWTFSHRMNWSRKQLIKKIVMSSTYRQDSRHRVELDEIDPQNRLLARQNRIRVPAEIIRDLYLSASGLLHTRIGGPSVFPPLPPGVADLSYANNFRWKTSSGKDRYRRGMYTFFKRTSPHPNMISFDCPDSNTTKIRRDSSNTPIQALVTLNNEVFLESAQALAARVLKTSLSNQRDRIRHAIKICLLRDPSEKEIDRFEKYLESSIEYYQGDPESAEKLTSVHRVADIPVAVNAGWVSTTRIILNLDEFIVRD